MVAVRINGSESTVNSTGAPRITDLIELVKTMIDPDHMITSILINGRELEDSDWSGQTRNYETAIIEFETGTPESYVTDRLSQAAYVIGNCYSEFRDARKSFQSGDMVRGNQKLLKAVRTLQSFFNWYGTLMEIVANPAERASFDISAQVTEISGICKNICQQQLYQSWWALGETLEKDLEPKLDALEDFLRKFEKQV